MTLIRSLSSHFHSVFCSARRCGHGLRKHTNTSEFSFRWRSWLQHCVCVCACVSCAQSPVESDNRTVILVKPPARPRPAPHIFHLPMYARFASFFPLVFSFCSGEMRSEGAFIYTGVSRLYFSFQSFLSLILFLSKAFKIRNPLPILWYSVCVRLKKNLLSLNRLFFYLSFLISIFLSWFLSFFLENLQSLKLSPCAVLENIDVWGTRRLENDWQRWSSPHWYQQHAVLIFLKFSWWFVLKKGPKKSTFKTQTRTSHPGFIKLNTLFVIGLQKLFLLCGVPDVFIVLAKYWMCLS